VDVDPVSEHSSSRLNVNFVCLFVCHGPTAYRKSLPAFIFAFFGSYDPSKNTREFKTWTMDSLSPQ